MRGKQGRVLAPLFFLFTAVIWLMISFTNPAFGARRLSVSPEYTGISVAQGEEVSVDLIVSNQGTRDENVFLEITSVPEGWDATIKTFKYPVTGAFVRSDNTKTLTFEARPVGEVPPGEYDFTISWKTRDGVLGSKTGVRVKVTKEVKEKATGGVEISTEYPVLRGPTDASFEFSLKVKNKLNKDGIFSLGSRAPENWEINFKPAYEEKLISSVRLKAGGSQSLGVEVKPDPTAKPGEYPIVIEVSSPEASGEAKLTVKLTGTRELKMGTADGLLSLDAVRGEKANLSFYVRNNGSATLNSLEFMSVKPKRWEVKFSPEKIGSLAPGEISQVEAEITPPDQALVGDYSVQLVTKAGKRLSKNLELRVTVRASAAWGWIGVGIIVLVVAGLVYLFIRLGRR